MNLTPSVIADICTNSEDFMKKSIILLSIFTFLILFIFNGCDSRKPVSQKQTEQYHSQFLERVSSDELWLNDYTFQVSENILSNQNGSVSYQLKNLTEQTMQLLFLKTEKFFRDNYEPLSKSSLTGYKIYGNRYICMIGLSDESIEFEASIEVTKLNYCFYHCDVSELEISISFYDEDGQNYDLVLQFF